MQNTFTDGVSEIACEAGGCVLPVDIAPNSSLGLELFESENIEQVYQMPEVTGEYFLLLVADAEEEIEEYDEFDNYFFPSLEPLSFDGGLLGLGGGKGGQTERAGARVALGQAVEMSALASGRAHAGAPIGNAYTPAEIKAVLAAAKRSGEFERRVAEGLGNSGPWNIRSVE